MGAYLDRLNSLHDEIKTGIDELVNRAADENRDVTDDEQKQVDRDKAKLQETAEAIAYYQGIEDSSSKVAELRAKARPQPAVVRAAPDKAKEYDPLEDFPNAGAYAITVHRAMVLKDPAAREKLERATQHQLLADNPGIVPTPVLGPVINLIDDSRPFIQSITRRPLPAGKFDRPRITQHVAIAEQTAEKTLTASQQLKIDELPVTAKTFAGHLNISRQNIKWTSPGIMQIVFDDFASQYAITTCDEACDDFLASLTSNTASPLPDWSGEAVTAALYSGAAAALSAGAGHPDTMWVSPDVWAELGGSFNSMGVAAFPQLSLTNTSGNPLGLSMVVDQHFPAGTFVTGPSRLLEWYEDLDGLMQVGEPDVLGQLVGYAGYAAFLNVEPDAFTVFSAPVAGP